MCKDCWSWNLLGAFAISLCQCFIVYVGRKIAETVGENMPLKIYAPYEVNFG